MAQNGEQMFEISVDHPSSQSQQGEMSLHIPLDQASVKAMSNREQDQTQKQQQGDGPDLKSRDSVRVNILLSPPMWVCCHGILCVTW